MFRKLSATVLFLALVVGSAFGAKTVFIDGVPSQGIKGTKVTAAFLNAVNKHYCTGLDVDGDCSLAYAADTGAANAYVVTLNPALTQYVTGMPIYFKAGAANTGASTVNVNGLGVKTIKKNNGTELISGDISAGQLIEIIYDGTYMWMVGPGGKISVTPAANTVPIRRSASPYVVDAAELAMTGEASSSNGSPVTITVGGGFQTVTSIDLGTVTAGDRILLYGSLLATKGATAGILEYGILKLSGTATTSPIGGTDNQQNQIANEATRVSSVVVMQITGSGTLVVHLFANAGGSNDSVVTGGGVLGAFFLKKQ